VSAPAGVERDYPLARLTTVRTGGPADFFARPDSEARLGELLAWAEGEELAVGVVGSGSNLLIADEGFRGLVLKLDGSLAAIEQDGERLLCGGGARLPQAAARAARAGLSGLEFGVNIPGTVGGAVKMNANAYGGDLARVLEWVEVTTPEGSERRGPEQLGFAYRRSNLGPREIVARAAFALSPAEPERVKATLADMREQRKAAQPSGIKTFGSTFKNPDDPRAEGRSAGVLLDEAGCRGLTVGGARFSEKHANFVENPGNATTADVVALMAEGRRRVRERFGVELEAEVQFLGEVDASALEGEEAPPGGQGGAHAEGPEGRE
jgi:UDP-N-acetylenolpyruvoylglucosamine reductase